MDRVVSSYTPTLRALRHARLRASSTGPPGQALIVAMPTTPGLPGAALPWVPAEAAMLTERLPSPVLLAEPDSRSSPNPDRLPTMENVLMNLPRSGIVHFACHGVSHPADPSRSMLLLHDYDRAPLTVASLAPVSLDSAQLAYLSACSTALTSTAELADEAINLTTAFQLAGFPHVIGTLWAIEDQSAAGVARAFYDHLATGTGNVDTARSADALHHAVRAARSRYPRIPFLWAGFLHSGA
jgi:CHAT domain-containing protein